MRIDHKIMIIISYAEHVITTHTSTATATTLHVNAPSRPLSVSSLFSHTTHTTTTTTTILFSYSAFSLP